MTDARDEVARNREIDRAATQAAKRIIGAATKVREAEIARMRLRSAPAPKPTKDETR